MNALKNVIYNTQTQQLDDSEVMAEDTIDEVDSDESSEGQSEIKVKEVLFCNFCDFRTEHKVAFKCTMEKAIRITAHLVGKLLVM